MTQSRFLVTIVGILAMAVPQIAQAANPLIEVRTAQRTFQGQSQAHDQHFCWLLEREGSLQKIAMKEVSGFRALPTPFRPCSSAELRTVLQQEFGRSLEIKGTTHYLVVAAPGHASRYAELFEQLYREFYVYLSTRNFPVAPAKFPFVAIIFPTHQQFLDYARSEGLQQTAGLAGYYSLRTNRVAAFDPATAVSQTSPNQKTATKTVAIRADQAASDLQQTLIHEATHQVAFNVGLHSRIGSTPRWVVEGLAMVFEHPEARSALKTSSPRQRVNRERYVWFGNYAKNRRPSRQLEEWLASDQAFQTATLDAYSEAWALSFFLMETRSSAYAQYLKTVASRDPLRPYSSAERLNDFRAAFGEDLARLEVEFLRYLERL